MKSLSLRNLCGSTHLYREKYFAVNEISITAKFLVHIYTEGNFSPLMNEIEITAKFSQFIIKRRVY